MSSHFAKVSPREVATAAGWALERAGRSSLYLRLNPIAADAVIASGKAAKDEHIASSRAILLDLDPHSCKRMKSGKRKGERRCPHAAALDDFDDPDGIRPDKLKAAAELVLELRAFVFERLGVLAPLLDSGRGRQLWLPTPAELTRDERKRFLVGLGRRFDLEGLVEVDLKCFNASRLCRLPGGRNKKTGGFSKLLDEGDGRTPDLEGFRALIDELAPIKAARPRAKKAGAARPTAAEPGAADRGSESPWTAAIREATAFGAVFALLGLDPLDEEGRGPCPIHGGTNPRSFSADWEPGRFYCHSCHAAGDVIALVAGVEGLDRLEARAWLGERLGVERPAEDAARLQMWAPVSAYTLADDLEGDAELARVYGGEGGAILDARATGAGKTYQATRRTVATASRAKRDGDDSPRIAWAVPSHAHADGEIIPNLEAAARELREADFTIGKLPPFACPLPDPDGDTRTKAYARAAGAGWNAAQIVCYGCPRFGRDAELACSYWAERTEAAAADAPVLQHQHLGLPGIFEGAVFEGVRAVVVDEDPSDALLQRHEIKAAGIERFLRLIQDAVSGSIPEEQAERMGDRKAARLRKRMTAKLEAYRNAGTDGAKRGRLARERVRLELEADAIKPEDELEAAYKERALGDDAHDALCDVLERLGALCRGAGDVETLELGDDVSDLLGPGAAWVEKRATAELRRRRQAADGDAVEAPPPNLWPAVRHLAGLWQAGRPGVLVRVRKGELSLPLPVGFPRALGLEVLDATGSVSLLEVITRRTIVVRGAPIDDAGKVHGLHLAGLARGRARYKGERGAGAIQRDADSIARYARNVGAKRVGLVTFLALEEELPRELERRGLEVAACLHWGAVAGSNAFKEADVSLAVIHGTPHVPPSAVRELAIILGADGAELLAVSAQEHYRAPAGGEVVELAYPAGVMRTAHRALVDRALVQALGRAYRGDWTPTAGLLVLSQAASSPVCSLRLSNARDEGLSGDPGLFLDDLGRILPPVERARLRELLASEWGSTTGAGGLEALARTGVELTRRAAKRAGSIASLAAQAGLHRPSLHRSVTRKPGGPLDLSVWGIAASWLGLASQVEPMAQVSRAQR